MKVATFNIHQYAELNRINTLYDIAEKIAALDLDMIGLQEVAEFEFDFSSEKATNTARLITHILNNEFGKEYHLSVNMFKYGYPYNKEGLAIISKHKFISENNVLVSDTTDVRNYHRREIQINEIEYEGRILTVVNGHYTWDCEEENFKVQLERLLPNLEDRECVLVGDFNNEPDTKNYELITKRYKDLYLEKLKDAETFNFEGEKMRIDYVFSNLDVEVVDHKQFFTEIMLSDHYMIYVEFKIN